MIASMMMYCHPRLDDANDRYWALIRSELAQRRIAAPEVLSNQADAFDVWNAPDLVISQTCGMPYRTWLHDKVALIGTPDFGVPDCPPGHYNSVIVVRSDDPRDTLASFRDAVFVYNQTFSQSGYAAPYATVRPLGFWFANRLESHGHFQSARAVAEGRADIAAIDAVTWRIIQRFEPFAEKLRVLTTTPATPGLPYIAAATADVDATAEAVRAAIARLSEDDRDALGITGLVSIPKQHYLAVANPPAADS